MNEKHTQPNPGWFETFCDLNRQNMSDENPMQHRLYSHLSRLSEDDLLARCSEIQRLMRSNGFIDGSLRDKWMIDPIPHLIDKSTWSNISRGLEQRVHLLNQVLQDITTTKSLILNHSIDGLSLFGHPFFLGESDYSQFDASLFVVALDIGLSKDGEIYALQDHCQFPRGLGLLLENRIMSRRVMSDEFFKCDVERIAGFFQDMSNAVEQHAPHADARVVIFSEGPSDPYYSEQVYLATYLGYTLVRSADLTVRQGFVWIKALNGLKKVDIILRWIEDRHLDSLEQSEYSEQGVPGLLQAIRSGNVQMLNNYGAGILQIPAIQNRLGHISQQLNQQALIIKQPLSFAPENVDMNDLARFELRSYIDPSLRLDGAKHAEEIEKILEEQPKANVFFREKVNLKEIPFWRDDKLVLKPVVFRVFALVHEDQVTVLPSALCITVNQDKLSKQTEVTHIKDAWVASDKTASTPEKKFKPPKSVLKTLDMALLEGYISSRTAENLFSLGTSVERTENLCRLLRVYMEKLSEWSMYPEGQVSQTLNLMNWGLEQQVLIAPFESIQWESSLPLDSNTITDYQSFKALAYRTITDSQLLGSLASTVKATCTSAKNIRELLSYDSQRILENLESEYDKIFHIHHASSVHILQSLIDNIISLAMAFRGSLTDSLSRDTGDFMFEMGIRTERIQSLLGGISLLIGPKLSSVAQRENLDMLLLSQVSSVTHKRRYRMHQSVSTALELLVSTQDYPRSLAYQIDQLEQLTYCLPRAFNGYGMDALERALLKLKSDCHIIDLTELNEVSDSGTSNGKQRTQLLELVSRLRQSLKSYTDLLNIKFFTHTKSAIKQNRSFVASNHKEGDVT